MTDCVLLVFLLGYCRASFSLRGALAPQVPGTGPAIVFHTRGQACVHWILQDVVLNLFEFRSIASGSVIAFMLPEWTPRSIQKQIGFPRGCSLESLHVNSWFNERSCKHVDMIRHDYPGVQAVILAVALLNGIFNYLCDLWHS